MAYLSNALSLPRAGSPSSVSRLLSTLGALKARISGFQNDYASYRQRRAVYLRTLHELQSYRPRELHDLRVHPADFEELARRQAGL